MPATINRLQESCNVLATFLSIATNEMIPVLMYISGVIKGDIIHICVMFDYRINEHTKNMGLIKPIVDRS